MTYTHPTNETEAEALLEHLKEIDGKDLAPGDCDILRSIFIETEFPGLRDLIARTLTEAEDEELYAPLINKIKQNIHHNTISRLVSAAGNYDCSEDIQLFVDLIVLREDVSVLLAIDIINDMEDIDDKERFIAIDRLTTHLPQVEAGSLKHRFVTGTIEYLKKYPEKPEDGKRIVHKRSSEDA